MKAMIITLEEAKGRLREIIHKGAVGEEIVITDGDGANFKVQVTPVANPQRERVIGAARDLIKIGDDFDDPIPGFEPYLL
jgi:antitoxin (DNA-binding transcriptional repressor) of toxin-antitoxin stability system